MKDEVKSRALKGMVQCMLVKAVEESEQTHSSVISSSASCEDVKLLM